LFKLNAKELVEGEEQLEKLKQHKRSLIGAEEEEKIFKEMQNSMNCLGIKNTIVINGWKDNGINNTIKREYDFLIICEPLRTMFHIESKTTFNGNNFENAAKQLKSGLDFFEDKLPFPECEKWSYVRVATFANMAEEILNLTDEMPNNTGERPKVCSMCQLFVVGPDWNFSKWWKEIAATLSSQECLESNVNSPEVRALWSPQSDTESTETYTDIVKFLLHQMLMQKDCMTDSDISSCTQEKIEMISTLENIFFWNNVQFSLLSDITNKRVVFASPFGTGKTSCIRAKVEQLLNDKQKVMIVVFQDRDTSTDSLLKKTYEIYFQDNQGQLKEGLIIESIRGARTCGFIISKIDTSNPASIK
jgi:hypothetical protein